jgi:filamentous hemagglutinin
VSAGTVTLTNAASQTQDIAKLSRDTTNTNGTVSGTPNVQNILSQQADTMQATQAAGQVVAQGIGAYADSKRDAAVAHAKVDTANGNTAALAADVAEASRWMEGGDARAMLQAAGGFLIGGLGGGIVFTAAGGALGAGLSSKLADQTKAATVAVSDATGSTLLGNLSGSFLAGVGGALVGGTAGAVTASNVDLYNRNNDTGNEQAKRDLATAQSQATFVQYAREFGQAMFNLVPGKQMADQAQTAFTNGNYRTGAALAVGSLVDAGVGILTGGESRAIESFVSGTKSASVQLSQQGLDLVASHLSQFEDDVANAGMLGRLQSAPAKGQSVTGADANFYLHEISESTLMRQGLSYDAAHAAAIAKYDVSPFELYAPEVIDANPTLFNNAWRRVAGLPPLK